ncbi:hypothetical protein ACHAWX_003986 [Stephanocyclus meneghinianus]
MSLCTDSLPLNITLSVGNVSFHLATATGRNAHCDDELRSPSIPVSSPQLRASPRTAAQRRRYQSRSRKQGVNFENDENAVHPKDADTQLPILTVRRGQARKQNPSPGRLQSNFPLKRNNDSPPESPMRHYILGRVRAMKEKIEIQERRQSSPMYGEGIRFNDALSGSSAPAYPQTNTQCSGYCVDLYSFTGTLNISSNVINCSNVSSSEFSKRSVRRYDLQSPRKRIAEKKESLVTLTKRPKTKNFTWIASNDSEVETGIDNSKSMSKQNQAHGGNGIPVTPSKNFDFHNAASDSDNDQIEGDIESGIAHSPRKSVRFSFGVPDGQSLLHGSQRSLHDVNSSARKLTLSAPQDLHPSTNIRKNVIQSTSRAVPKEKTRISFSSPPKLLHYARQTSTALARSSRNAMKQIGLSGGDSYDVLGSDPALNTNDSLSSFSQVVDGVVGFGYNETVSTELHCACASLDLARIYKALQNCDASDAMASDGQGKYPIHLFAENHDLITEHPAECEEVVGLFVELMGPDKIVQALYPSSGWGPFVGIIGRWVDQLHHEIVNQQIGLPAADSPPSVIASGANESRPRKKFAQLPLFRTSDKNERVISSTFMRDRDKAFFLPYSVAMNDYVKWSIRVLSSLIDVHPLQTREAILTNMTSTVPLFLKCLFLLNDSDVLNSLAEMSLVKHVIIDKRSINVWLIAMLTSTTREIKMRAVSYLKLLSRLTLSDLAATSQYRERYSDLEIERFARLRKECFDALYSMPGIFPAVLGLGGNGIESLSTTRVMRYITDRTIRKEKQFFRLICDFFYGIFLLIGYRMQVEFVFSYSHRDGPPGYRDNNYWSMSTYAIAFYFLVKDLMSLFSLYLTSTKLAKRYCTSVFNIIDMSAVLILVVMSGSPTRDDSISMSDGWASSLVIVLLWLKVLGAFKVLNQSFALFLYAVWEVVKEIKWFIVFLCAVTIMFSDAARAAVAVTGNCDKETDASSDFCSDGFWTISRMYSVLVGDVSLDYFQSSSLMLVVFIFFSFFCIIILLNILIAIIIDSYERTKERSREIFGRAQVEYAAALVARNQFIRVSVKRSRNSSAIFRNRS